MTPAKTMDPVVNPSNEETRFGFGKNWTRFLICLDEERIQEAENSLKSMLQVENLAGQSFLDIGCGSGLFSLAAMRLGARRVHSLDYDPQSVACAHELKRRYFPEAGHWTVEQGNVLDAQYLSRLGKYDVVYAWGVLHHTGNMWQALENVLLPVASDGRLFVAIYNDQGARSRVWMRIKKAYNRNVFWRAAIVSFFAVYYGVRLPIHDLVRLKNPVARYREYRKARGMSYLTDLLDWLGGYPFEVAKREAVIEFFRQRNFALSKLSSAGDGTGNNEFVFCRSAPSNQQ